MGQAFILDGSDDHVLIPDNSNETPDSITAEALVFADDLVDDGWGKAIVSKYGSSTFGQSWFLGSVSGGRVRFGVYGKKNTARMVDTDNVVLTSSIWHHVAGTFDLSTQAIKVYVDGIEVSSSFVPDQDDTLNSVWDTEDPIRVGAYINANGDLVGAWDGRIDEVVVSDRALSAEEIQAIFQAGSAGKWTGG